MNVTEFPETEINLEKTLRNIQHGDIDHVILLTLDKNDIVNLYTTAGKELTEQILEAHTGNVTFRLD